MMNHDEVNEDAAARLLSCVCRVGDRVEAVYIGADDGPPRERTVWRVVRHQGQMALLVPQPLPADWPGDAYAVPMRKLAKQKLLDKP